MANLTQQTWDLGRSQGLSNKEIRANWKSLWGQIYEENITQYKSGIQAIISELENTIQSHTKTSQTEAAEMSSLENIKTVIQTSINRNGYQKTFEILSELYDNGAGEWIQRIVMAIYDSELAQWANGLPQYISRLQSEIISAFGVEVPENQLNLTFFDEEEVDNYYKMSKKDNDIFINGTKEMDVNRLDDLVHGRI